jgi:YVTN family beta-propeller protein
MNVRRIFRSLVASLVFFPFTLLLSPVLPGQQPYRMIDKWNVGGTGTWDYLAFDAAANRLYVAHNARVEVIDTESGKLVGAVEGLKSTHGIALNLDTRTGYISDGAGNAVIVFDRATLQVTATIAAGTNPDGIVYEPTTATVWAFNGKSLNATVIDTTTRKVIATVPVPDKPEFPVADGTGTIFVNIDGKNEIARIDARQQKIVAEWPLTGCESPSGLSFDPVHRRLFSVCDGGKMAVVDANTGKQLASVAIGDGPDAVVFDPKRQLVFTSNGDDGTLSIIDAGRNNFPAIQTLKTLKGARTMAYDATSGRAFLAWAKFAEAAAATPTATHTRPKGIEAGSFVILVVGK